MQYTIEKMIDINYDGKKEELIRITTYYDKEMKQVKMIAYKDNNNNYHRQSFDYSPTITTYFPNGQIKAEAYLMHGRYFNWYELPELTKYNEFGEIVLEFYDGQDIDPNRLIFYYLGYLIKDISYYRLKPINRRVINSLLNIGQLDETLKERQEEYTRTRIIL